jgi:hypothetical protein
MGVRAIGQHSSATPEWGTTARILDLGREVIGPFDVDPTSSPFWNRTVRAARIITAREDCRKVPWVPGGPLPTAITPARRGGKPERYTAIVNPPGSRDGELVAFCWRALAGYHELGWITSAIWVGFSVEQLSRLQRVDAASHPLEHVTLVPSRRLHYRPRRGAAAAPGHASFVTLLTTSPREAARFAQLGRPLGHVIRGSRWR